MTETHTVNRCDDHGELDAIIQLDDDDEKYCLQCAKDAIKQNCTPIHILDYTVLTVKLTE